MSRHPDAHIVETDAMAAELDAAGLITIGVAEDNEPVYRLTREGAAQRRCLRRCVSGSPVASDRDRFA